MLKQVHSPSMDGNQSWYFRKQACSYCIKNIPMEISWFFVICDKFWPCFETVRFWKAISHRHKWLKSKIMWNITSNQREKKTVDRIGLLNLSWYQRNYSIFVTFRNSVAVQVYRNDVDDFLFFSGNDTIRGIIAPNSVGQLFFSLFSQKEEVVGSK